MQERLLLSDYDMCVTAFSEELIKKFDPKNTETISFNKNKKIKIPNGWQKYKNSKFKIINSENFDEFVL